MEEDSITKFKIKHVPGTKGLINTFKKVFHLKWSHLRSQSCTCSLQANALLHSLILHILFYILLKILRILIYNIILRMLLYSIIESFMHYNLLYYWTFYAFYSIIFLNILRILFYYITEHFSPFQNVISTFMNFPFCTFSVAILLVSLSLFFLW